MCGTENNIDSQTIKKILVIQFRPFGDVLLATSYLEALKKKFPHATIDFLVKKPFHDILYRNPWISQIVAIEQPSGIRYVTDRLQLFRDIRHRCYDLIIDQQSGTGSGQVVFFSKATYKLGWSSGRWHWCYNLKAKKGPVRYRSSQNFDMLQPLGISEKPHQLFYHIKPESMAYAKAWLDSHQMIPDETIIISPGSPREKKKWRAENFSMLADKLLLKTKMQVIILCGPKEYADAKAVLARSHQACHLALSTDFNHASAFLKHCRLLICNDGGINHLSVALGVPSLAIFGNTPPAKWSPQGFFPYHYHLVSPDRKKRTDNHFGITPEEAFQKVLAILAELSSANIFSSSQNFSKT
jgi:ADP-heptose:LPS heptosyltransferase